MWAATYEEGGHNTYSCSFSQHPHKLWTDTVSRLHALRQQHWQQTSKLIALHQHVRHQHPHQGQHSYRRPEQYQQSFQHRRQRKLPHHQSQYHKEHGPARRPPFPTNDRSPHPFTSNDGPQGFNNARIQRPGFCKPREQNGLEIVTPRSPSAAKNTHAKEKVGHQFATGTEHETKDQAVDRSPSKRTRLIPTACFAEVHPVPLGLVSETNSKALKHMVEKTVDSYMKQLKHSTSTVEKYYHHLKPPPLIHAGSLYHFKAPNLGQGDFEAWMKKHRRKKTSGPSSCGTNFAFGRSITSRRCTIGVVTTKDDAKAGNSTFIKCLRGKLNARREVLKAIQDYHINAEARAQLEKRASEYEQETRERQRKMAKCKKQAAIERSVVLKDTQQSRLFKTPN